MDRIPDSTVVNVATWLWVDPLTWRTYHARVSGGGYVATVWAEPVTVTWTAGWDFASAAEDPEGGTTYAPESLDQVCDGPGTVYDRANAARQPACAFDFSQSSFGTRQPLTATVTWQVWWALSGPTGVVGGEGSLGLAHLHASEGLRSCKSSRSSAPLGMRVPTDRDYETRSRGPSACGARTPRR